MGAESTDSSQNVIQDLEFLTRSSNRIQILETLTETDRVEKDELQAAIEADRTTLTRNLDALEERGWIRTDNPTCTVTPAGRDIVGNLLDLEETVEVAVRLQEFFRWIPADEFDLDIQTLADAEILIPEPGDPYSMISRHIEKMKDMEHGYALLPFTGLHAIETAHHQIVHEGASGGIVVEPDVAETFRSNAQYRELAEEMVETGRFTVRVYRGSFPYAINIVDETVHLVAVEDDEPGPMLESDDEDVLEWAEHTYEEHKRQADQVI